MPPAKTFGQPWLGVTSAIATVGLALAICVQFTQPTFVGWVGEVIMCAIPFQIVAIAVWQGNYPGFLARLDQPAKGAAIVALMAVASAIVTPGILMTVGGSISPPTPFVTMFTVLTVCTPFWVMPLFQCWPVTAMTKHPAGLGLGLLALSYGSAWIIWQLGFDFSAMKDAPFYAAALDPKGAFPAWDIVTFMVTASFVIVGLMMFDYWPVTVAVERIPVLGRQPARTIFSAASVLAVTAAIWSAFVLGFRMDPVDYMVRVPVSCLFGQLLMMHMMQTAPFQAKAQPGKGLALMSVVVVLAAPMYWLYGLAALALVGPMASGAPRYALDIWIATAMLAVTFPLFVAFGEGFRFWPLLRSGAGQEG